MSIEIKVWISDQGPISHRRPQPAVLEYYVPLVSLADVVAWLREGEAKAKAKAQEYFSFGSDSYGVYHQERARELASRADHLEALLKEAEK